MNYSILGCIIHLFRCARSMPTHFIDAFQFFFMKIDQVVAGISTFEIPGSEWNKIFKTTVSVQKITFSARW